MAKKEISKNRKRFRRVLYGLAFLSFVFFTCVVSLRMNRSAHWHVVRNYSEELFAFDVWQHQVRASMQDINARHATASSLLQKGFFSNQYAVAGTDMMKELADDGYAPSQIVYGDILLNSRDEKDRAKARYYYNLAAAESYPLAFERLEATK